MTALVKAEGYRGATRELTVDVPTPEDRDFDPSFRVIAEQKADVGNDGLAPWKATGEPALLMSHGGGVGNQGRIAIPLRSLRHVAEALDALADELKL